MGVIGKEGGYGSGNDGFGGEEECVVGVDGIDELGADGLADAHGEVVFDLDGEGSSGGNGDWSALADCEWGQQKRQKQERSDHHLI